MSENVLIAITIIAFVPLTLWIKKFLDAVTANTNQQTLENSQKAASSHEVEKTHQPGSVEKKL